jgi:hypothetical protein
VRCRSGGTHLDRRRGLRVIPASVETSSVATGADMSARVL